MPKDEIDDKAARLTGWTLALDEASARRAAAALPAEASSSEATPAGGTSFVVLMTALIQHAWPLPHTEQQPVVLELAWQLSYAEGQAVSLWRPPLAARLLWLLLAHRDVMQDELADEAAEAMGFAPLLDQPGFDALAVAVARTAEPRWLIALDTSLGERRDGHHAAPELGVALARLLDDPTAPLPARRHAAKWLRCGRWPEAQPALQRALRDPDPLLSQWALLALGVSGLLTSDDLLHVLREAADGDSFADPDETPGFDLALWYPVLHAAVCALRPPEAAALLTRLANGEGSLHGDRNVRWWAYDALATAYPEAALPVLDESLIRWDDTFRLKALQALAHLPLSLAAPRLAAAGADPAASLGALARAQHEARTGRPSPRQPADAPLFDGLPRPRSQRFTDRLAALQALDDEPARAALVKRLHAERCRSERHRTENGLLLLAWYAEEDHLKGTPIPESMSSPFSARAVELRQRFGPAVTAGLLSLARAFKCASDGPLPALRDLDALGLLTDEERESARTIALQKYQQAPGYPHSSHLAQLGCPRGGWAPLLQAIDDPLEGNPLLEALGRCSDPALPLQVTTELEAALPLSARAVALARLGVSLGLPGAVQAGLETLRRARTEDEVSRVQVLAGELVEAKRLTHDDLRRELADPHSPRFLLGTNTFEYRAAVPPEYVEPLLCGLVGLPQCAQAAALCLIGAGRLSHEDPRLPPLYARLDTKGRETFLSIMLLLRCDPEPWTAVLMEWLTTQPADASGVAHLLTRTPAGTAIVRTARAQISDPKLQKKLDAMLK